MNYERKRKNYCLIFIYVFSIVENYKGQFCNTWAVILLDRNKKTLQYIMILVVQSQQRVTHGQKGFWAKATLTNTSDVSNVLSEKVKSNIVWPDLS